MLDKLRNRCEEILNTTEKRDKYVLIKNILKNDNCFFEMDINTAISIIIDLGFSEIEAKKIYLSLIKKDNFK